MPMMDISAREISSIQAVEANNKNVVLLISQRNASRPLVVKSEEGAGRNNVGAMLEFHASAFSKLRSLPFETTRLTLKEIEELKRCDPAKVKAHPPLTQAQWLQKLDELLRTSNGQIKTAIKVSFVEALANLHGIARDLEQKQRLGEELVRGNLDIPFGLGEILAVDFFIGNGDRFREVSTSARYPRGSILGDQNVFFQMKDGKFTTVGLDTYDGAGPWSDLNRTIEDLEAYNKRNMGADYALWPGRILAPGARRDYIRLDGQVRRPTIEPYSLRRSQSGEISLAGFDVDAGHIKMYRVDRIQSARVLDRTFSPRYAIELGPLARVLPIATRPATTMTSRVATGSSRRSSFARPSRTRAAGVPTYVVECMYCRKKFRRRSYDTALNAHKMPSGWDCPGRAGAVVDTKW
jgi:hypothetical protein